MIEQKKVSVIRDNITDEISKSFDFEFNGEVTFNVPKFTLPKEEFNIGLIVGASGSGKSTILNSFGTEEQITWDSNKSIASHFEDHVEATERLSSVGLNCIPTWLKPYHVLSTGERFRADLSRRIKDNAIIDEYTSVIDRNVAKSCSHATQKYIRNNNIKNVVFASCHMDIIEWLQPDWTFDTTTQKVESRGFLRRPKIVLELLPCSYKMWSYFSEHHYLTGKINRSARCWVVLWNKRAIGFTSIIFFPSGTIKEKAWREHRTVILPDFQGLGIGVRIGDVLGSQLRKMGHRFFSKTAHPRMGEYRDANPHLWKQSSTYKKNRKKDYENAMVRKNIIKGTTLLEKNVYDDGRKSRPFYNAELYQKHKERVCYVHEYIGEN